MTDLNSVILRGRMVADAKEGLKTGRSGTAYGGFCVCLNRSRKDNNGDWQDYPHFVNIHAMGKAYENACEYMTKGSVVTIEGHLEVDKWDDKETGKQRSVIVVCADRIFPTYPPKDDRGGGRGGRYRDDDYDDRRSSRGSSRSSTKPSSRRDDDYDYSNDEGFPEDIPF